MKTLGFPPKSIEGKQSADWILLDLGDILVHIFNDVSRDSFALDQLWGECKQMEIPQEYYFSGPEEEGNNDDSGENYF